MENKINIAKLLKDCPKGMELDCTMFDNITFEGINKQSKFPIIIKIGEHYKYLTKEGCYHDTNCIAESKCVIFPKGKTTWEGFVQPCKFKDGDIITNPLGTCIFKGEGKIKGTVDYYCGISSDYFNVKDNKCSPNEHYGDIVDYRLATEEEKEKLFQAIKDNGYKWNPDTKTLEKLPKFKVGDKVRHKTTNKDDVYEIDKVYDDSYGLVGFTWMIYMKYQDQYELVHNKFDINTLVPFESKVLVRAVDNQFWRPAIWGVKHCDWDFCCVLGGEMWEQCIPYEGNEHLLGTNNDCDKYFKIWES